MQLVQGQVGRLWQITPRVLIEARATGGVEAKRAFDAMMTMRKLDVAKIEAARRGDNPTSGAFFSRWMRVSGEGQPRPHRKAPPERG